MLRGSGMLAVCAQGMAARKIATNDAEKGALSFITAMSIHKGWRCQFSKIP